MAKRVVIDLRQPYLASVPVNLQVGDKEIEVRLKVKFKHVTDEDTIQQFNADLLDRIVDSVVDGPTFLDNQGEELTGENLRQFVIHYAHTQNALISAWREGITKKNLRIV